MMISTNTLIRTIGAISGLMMISIASVHVGMKIGTSMKEQRAQQGSRDNHRELQDATVPVTMPIHPHLQEKVYIPTTDLQEALDIIRNGLIDNTGNTTLFMDMLNNIPTSVNDITIEQYNNSNELAEVRAISWLLYMDMNYHYKELLITRYALTYMYYYHNGTNWKYNNTNQLSINHHHCNWYGITCCKNLLTSPVCANISTSNADGITEIDLYNQSISSNINTPIYLLFHNDLQSIFLNENNLTGIIPEYLLTLPKLSKLYLQHNQLTGTVPNNVYNGVLGKALYTIIKITPSFFPFLFPFPFSYQSSFFLSLLTFIIIN